MPNGNRLLNLFFSKNNFLGSFNDIYKIPNADLHECCFIGRSNVGKSSMINAITKTKKLAKISKTPGRTQSANLFEINKTVNIVDLPGYGYARVSKNTRYQLSNLIESYISNRNNLVKNHKYKIDNLIEIQNLTELIVILNNNSKKWRIINE